MFRRSTDQRGVPCTALIPLCAPYFDVIPESAPSCKAPQSLDCYIYKDCSCFSPSCKAPQSLDCCIYKDCSCFSPSCKAPQSLDCCIYKDCSCFSCENAVRCAELRHVWQKAAQYASRTNPEANHISVVCFLSKSGAQICH